MYGLESTLPVECEIPSLKLAVELLPATSAEEERLLYLERLDETRRLAALVIEAQKKRVKAHFDQSVSPRSFVEGASSSYTIKCMTSLGPVSSNLCGMGPT